MMELCEYDPEWGCPATTEHGCRNEATICVGADGKWHLCASCAELSVFRRLKKAPLPVRKRAQETTR